MFHMYRAYPEFAMFLIDQNSLQPTTQHFPMPRATTAACEVMPPRAVRIPCAAYMPPTSSGEVSGRTRMTFSPC